jgi:hypothetical protein
MADNEMLENHVPGKNSRNCIMSAMHFDFQNAMTQSNFSDSLLKNREEAANMQIVNNILRNLKDIKAT